MRMVFGLVLVLGLGLAGFAVWMAQGYISQTQADLERERAARARAVPTVEVYVVNKALNFGDVLTEDDVQTIAWPENAVPETAFRKKEDLFPGDGSKQRVVIRQFEKFEPVLAVKITEPGEDAGLTARLGRGMRAFAINVDMASGVAGVLRPSDRVDVYWTGRVDMNEGELTRLIESNIQIVGVGDASGVGARTVTVSATPQQVARLAQAQAMGRLALSLVGIGDSDTPGELVEVSRNALLGIQEREEVEIEREKVCTIRTRRGADVVEIPIPCTN